MQHATFTSTTTTNGAKKTLATLVATIAFEELYGGGGEAENGKAFSYPLLSEELNL